MVLKKEKFNFTKSYSELQKIVEWFERDDIDLEEGIKKFEEGSVLVKDLKEYLETMENKIKELKKE
jgi:exodeoxyribonuclease VII small subunit